ncbi:glycosyltransferase [Actinomadura craniellae]|nr:glycosyltransferase [Actinomadura craniellae]
MRVLIVSDSYPPLPDGVAQSTAALLAGLTEIGHQAAVVAPSHRNTANDSPRVHRVRSVPAVIADYPLSLITPRGFRPLGHRFRPDVVHIQTLAPLGFAAAVYCRRYGVPAVLSWHTDVIEYRTAHRALNFAIPALHGLWNWRERPGRTAAEVGAVAAKSLAGRDVTPEHVRMLDSAVGFFDEVIVPSRKCLLRPPLHETDRPAAVIPTAVAGDVPMTAADLPAYQAAQAKLDPARTTIAFVGRPSPEKGLEDLFEALQRFVLPAHPRIQLAVIGSYRGDERYRRLATEMGLEDTVRFLGALPNSVVRALLRDCALLAHPSLTETQGIVLTEAALAGIPAIVMDTDLGETVRHGETGIVAETLESFGHGITGLLSDEPLRQKLGDVAREQALAYTPAVFAGRVAEVYRSALAAKRPGTAR